MNESFLGLVTPTTGGKILIISLFFSSSKSWRNELSRSYLAEGLFSFDVRHYSMKSFISGSAILYKP